MQAGIYLVLLYLLFITQVAACHTNHGTALTFLHALSIPRHAGAQSLLLMCRIGYIIHFTQALKRTQALRADMRLMALRMRRQLLYILWGVIDLIKTVKKFSITQTGGLGILMFGQDNTRLIKEVEWLRLIGWVRAVIRTLLKTAIVVEDTLVRLAVLGVG